jgi:indole-3-glycerol phosphate synthase
VQEKAVGLIAEVKRASPSKGVIREKFNPVEIATAYAEAGASCISVLTDVPYFQGEDSYLVDVRSHVPLPVLRKDFMLEPYQIKESRALGADCILLIMAALSDVQAAELEQAALELGMDVLVEVHDEAECERALKLKSTLLGVNNRNLKTLTVDLSTTEKLATMVPDNYTLVCESGIATHQEIERMNKAGAYCFLVGESLMREKDIAAATRKLLGTEV